MAAPAAARATRWRTRTHTSKKNQRVHKSYYESSRTFSTESTHGSSAQPQSCDRRRSSAFVACSRCCTAAWRAIEEAAQLDEHTHMHLRLSWRCPSTRRTQRAHRSPPSEMQGSMRKKKCCCRARHRRDVCRGSAKHRRLPLASAMCTRKAGSNQ